MKTKLSLQIFFTLLFTLASSLPAFAASGDMAIDRKDITFSTNNFLEGRTVRIYATASNLSTKDLLGVVRFYDNGKQISGDQAISIFAGKSDGVFLDWTPTFGNHEIIVKIFPWQPEIDDPSNNDITETVAVIQDTDHDGNPNTSDDDDDNDGSKDTEDHFPLNPKEQKDTDGDSIGDNADLDDDNDGVPDTSDDLPKDPNETIDTDKDGIGNIGDTDDDNDGIPDTEEENTGTNPTQPDTDNDGADDKKDAFPIDPTETTDTDKDKIGNNTDIDDDNDSIPDLEDKFPLNKPPKILLADEDSSLNLQDEHTFDASPSIDEDGSIVSYEWEVDGIVKEGNSITHKFSTLGPHVVKLSITDDSGETKTQDFQVNILNIEFYKQIGITFAVILLALAIYFKYIHSRGSQKEPKSKPLN